VKQQNTIAGYDTFMLRYPEAIEFREAEMLRNQLAYIQLLEQQSTQKSEDLAKADAKIEQTGNWLNLVLGVLAAAIVLGFVVYRSYLAKKRANKEITEQKEIIEQKNIEIVDSINYAKRIQDSMLPSLDEIRKHLPETFVFYRPRNIVSGDFYWFAQTGDRIYIAAADCTGHGVPGSLVSMIGFNFLNQVVNELGITNPGEILDELHKRISLTLNKDQGVEASVMRDGMDVALLSINRATREVTFSGAVRPLVYVDDEGIKAIRSGMYSIGGIKDLNSDLYPTHRIQTKGKATFYLFSDGYADQFGGPQGKKFKMKKLQELLAQASKESVHKQEQIIAAAFDQWIGNHEQVDDVCVIGVRY
jgi:phosphoserine phosphatase RsbU/P